MTQLFPWHYAHWLTAFSDNLLERASHRRQHKDMHSIIQQSPSSTLELCTNRQLAYARNSCQQTEIMISTLVLLVKVHTSQTFLATAML